MYVLELTAPTLDTTHSIQSTRHVDHATSLTDSTFTIEFNGAESVAVPLSAHSAEVRMAIDDLASAGVDIETVLENLVADFRLAEESLECSNYAGPMFLPYNPGGHIRKKNSIRAAKLPDSLEAQPTLRPTRWPLAPFSVHDVRLLPGSRFAAAEATNLAFLWRSW